MMKSRLLLFFLCCCLFLSSMASHIIGGGFSLRWKQGAGYELHLQALRDCRNGVALFDNEIYVGMFDRANNHLVATFLLQLDSVRNSPVDSASCFHTPAGMCIEVGHYTKLIQLPDTLYGSDSGYYFSWERCCRNSMIANVLDPQSSGITFYLAVPSLKQVHNSTPQWSSTPNRVLCKDKLFTQNFQLTDPDGDSLHYSLVRPLKGTLDPTMPLSNDPHGGPYAGIQWAAGFDDTLMIAGYPPLRIDAITGTVTVIPDSEALYAFAIRAEEFRQGRKLGETRIELQFMVASAPPVTGLAPVTAEPTLHVYPNPSHGKVFFDLAEHTGNALLQLSDMSGRIMLQQPLQKGTNAISTAGWPAGLYLYRIGTLHGKLMLAD